METAKKSAFTLFSLLTLFFMVSCSSEPVQRERVWWNWFDTIVRVRIYSTAKLPQASIDSIFAVAEHEFALWDSLCNQYDTLSAVYSINNSNSDTIHIDSAFGAFLQECFFQSEKFQFCVDPRIGHLVNLWGIGKKDHFIPEPAEIDSVLALIKSSELKFANSSLAIKKGDIQLDLGAFAKGWAVDRAYDELLEKIKGDERILGFLIDAGRNIRGWSRKNEGFRIGVANPRGEGIVASFYLPSTFACASSGDYERFFMKNSIRYHHIFDPKTGYPSRGVIAATAIGPNAFICDVASTATMIIGNDIRKILADTNWAFIIFTENQQGVKFETYGADYQIIPAGGTK